MSGRTEKIAKIVIFAIGVLVLTSMVKTSASAATKAELAALRAGFDATYYYVNNPDVAAILGSDPDKLFDHYVNYGINEGRAANAAMAATAPKNESKTASNGKVLAIYSTKYSTKAARAINIGLASASLNGTVVKPNEVFSFVNAVGPRTVERGYVVAPVFVSGTHSEGIGGGICQVSSTLYAAMLSAGIPAVERHAHSLPVTYLPAGMDATVSGTTLDLKFVNNFDKPIVINSVTNGGVIYVSLTLSE
ncbi:MAG: VanW family protein [Lachnospiraceae bacterium]|nr:VanW family protein [Candidatus Colinaster equi]